MSKDPNLKEELVGEEYAEEKTPGGFSSALNKLFHHLDRGGSLGGELVSGLTMSLLAVCVIFMNMQVIGNFLVGNYVPVNSPLDPDNISAAMSYAELYSGGVLISVIGTIVIGIIANLPLVQISTMGIFSSVICLLGASGGLTYQNLLFINLIAGVLYAVIACVPALRDGVKKALPSAVKKALPAALGAILFVVALRFSGFVSFGDLSYGFNGGGVIGLPSGVSFTGRVLKIGGLMGSAAAIVLYALLRAFKRNRASLYSLLLGTAVFMILSVSLGGIDTANSESLINFGRVWLIAGSQASAQTPFADSFLSYAANAAAAAFAYATRLFSEGMDFSAYTGNSLALIIGACLTYLLSGIYHAEGTVLAVDDTADTGRALAVNGLTNLVAPFLGVGGVTVSKVSVAGAKDGAKSGLAAVFAGLFTLISLFVMAFPALFATETYPVGSMNQWNYFAYGNGGFLYLVQGAVFSVVDIVMACVGISMVAGAWKNGIGAKEIVPFLVMLVAALLTSNLVAAVTLGILFALLFDREEVNAGTFVFLVLGVLSVVLI